MSGSPLQTTLLPAMAGTANLSTVSPVYLQLTVFQILHLVQQNHKLLQLIQDSAPHQDTSILQYLDKVKNTCQQLELKTDCKIISYETAKIKSSLSEMEQIINETQAHKQIIRDLETQGENCTKWSHSLQSEVNDKAIDNQLLREKLRNETVSNKISESRIIELEAKMNDSIKSTQECHDKSAEEVLLIRKEMERNKEEYEQKLQQKGTETERLQDLARQAKEINKRYALNKAVQDNNIGAVRILLEAGMSTETVDSLGYRPLHNASYWGYLEIVKLLVKHGANLTARTQDQFKSSCLHQAAYNNHLEVVKYLQSVGVPVDIINKYGQTPLGGAAWYGRYDTAQFLIASGADVNIHNILNDLRTPLHSAAYRGHPHIVELLLKNSANIESLDKDSKTPLHWAGWGGSLEAVKVLVKHGANVHAKSNFGKTPKDIAATKGFSEIVQFLELQ